MLNSTIVTEFFILGLNRVNEKFSPAITDRKVMFAWFGIYSLLFLVCFIYLMRKKKKR